MIQKDALRWMSLIVFAVVFLGGCPGQELAVPDMEIPESVTVVSSGEFYPYRSSFSLVVFQNKLWIFGGSRTVVTKNGEYEQVPHHDVWNSMDGIHWTKVAGGVEKANTRIVVFKDALWSIGGSVPHESGQGYRYLREIWKSDDGVNWELIDIPAETAPPARSWQVLEFDGNLWAMGGGAIEEGIPEKDGVWKSRDGKQWMEVMAQLPARYVRGQFFPLEDTILYVSTRRKQGGIWESENGETWTPVNVNEATFNKVFNFKGIRSRAGYASTIHNDQLYVLGGWNYPTNTERYSNLLNDVWRTSEGETWERMSDRDEETDRYMDNFDTFLARSDHSVVSFRGMLYLTGGQGEGKLVGPNTWEPTNYRDAWVSRDGKTWYELARVEE